MQRSFLATQAPPLGEKSQISKMALVPKEKKTFYKQRQ